ncbi:MAG: dienelactone hydrolase family protein [Rhodothermales bacterium]|nr:dienelactone hydrolase family protein [Rhodothermales bacterium]
MADYLIDPHTGGSVAVAGAPLAGALAVVILVHGRGASAEGMLDLARHFWRDDVAYLAPQAAGATWYPHSFLAPITRNEPGLSSALWVLDGLVEQAGAAGVPAERVLLVGFSQGACLALEFAARHPRRYGGVAALSGGLIGSGEHPGAPPPDDKAFVYPGSLAGTPVLLGCSDNDPHIPVARVHRSAEVLTALGAVVDKRIFPGMGHTVHPDEIAVIEGWLGG